VIAWHFCLLHSGISLIQGDIAVIAVTRKCFEMYFYLHPFGVALERARARATGHRHVSIEDVNAGYHIVG
jgi:hypothetical protein